MTCEITKLTDGDLMRRACAFTSGTVESAAKLSTMYDCEHSPIRTQIFWIELRDILSFVSVHLCRHHVGVTHFVKTNRDDRTGIDGSKINRLTPVNHAMLINAQGLIDMSRKRLCRKAHIETRKTFYEIRCRIEIVDFVLADYLVPECYYRGRCHEIKPCDGGYREPWCEKGES